MVEIKRKTLVDCEKSDIKKFYELHTKYKNATADSKRGEAIYDLLVFTQKLGLSSLVDAIMDKEFKNDKPEKKFMIRLAIIGLSLK